MFLVLIGPIPNYLKKLLIFETTFNVYSIISGTNSTTVHILYLLRTLYKGKENNSISDNAIQ